MEKPCTPDKELKRRFPCNSVSLKSFDFLELKITLESLMIPRNLKLIEFFYDKNKNNKSLFIHQY